MKTTNVLLGFIAILLTAIIILLLRNNPTRFKGLEGLAAKLTEPPQPEANFELFTFDGNNGVENSNAQTCLIIYNFDFHSVAPAVITQSNLVHSASEIVEALSKYGWQVNNKDGGLYKMIRPSGQTNGFFFVGDPDDTNKVLIP